MDSFGGSGQSLGAAQGEIRLDASGALSALNAVGSGLRNLDQQSAGGLTGMAQGILRNEQAFTAVGQSALGAGAAIMGAFGLGLNSAANFEQGMNRVKALTNATGDEFDYLKARALEMSSTTRYTATETADAMGYLAMAGFDVNEIYAALPGTLNLAAAAQMDVGRAADISSNILTAFGMEADQLTDVADKMTYTFTNSNTSMEQLGDAFKYVGPVASAAGLSFDEVAAMLGRLGDAGIQGSMAGTTLRGAITRLISPTAKTAKTLEELGVSITDSSGKMLPMTDILAQFPPVSADAASAMMQLQSAADSSGVALENMDGSARPLPDVLADLEAAGVDTSSMMDALGGDAETVAAIMDIFGLRAGPGMLALLSQGTDGLKEFTGEIANAGGTAERVANTQMEGLKGSLMLLASAWEALMVRMMDAGPLQAVTRLVQGLTGLVQVISRLPAPVLGAIAAITGITGVLLTLGGVFLLLLPRMARTYLAFQQFRAWGGMARVFSSVSTAIRGLAVAFRALTIANPVMLALTAAVALFFAYQNNWFGIRDGINAVVNAFMGLSIVQTIMGGIQSAIAAVTGFIASVVGHFNRLRESVNPVQAAFQAVAMAISELGGGSLGPIQYLADVFWNLGAIVTTVASAIKAAFEGDWGKAAATIIKGWSNVDALLTAVRKLASSLVDEFDDIASTVRRSVVRAFDDLGRRFSSFQGTFSRLGGYLSGMIGVVQGVVSAFAALFRGDFRGFAEGMIDAFTSALDAAQNAMLVIPTLVYEAFQAIDWGEVGSLLLDGLEIASDLLMDALQEAGSAIADVFRDIDWGGAWGSLINAAQAAIGWVIGAIAGIDWGALVQGGWNIIQRGISLAWDAITSLNWADFVPDVVWSAFVTAVDLAAKVGTFLWDTFVTAVDLTAKVGSLAWSMFVKSVDLASKVAVFTWNAYVTAVDLAEKVGIFVWSHFVTAVDLAAKVGAFAWDTFVTAVDLTTKVAALVWSSFVTALTTWSDFITSISWSTFVPSIAWSDFVPSINWSDWIPEFPGWEALNPFSGDGDGGGGDVKNPGGGGGAGFTGIGGTQLSFGTGGLSTGPIDDYRMALLALQRTLTSTQDAFTSFVASTIGVMGGWTTGIQTQVNSAMDTLKSRASGGTAAGLASFTSFVSQTIGVMGGWSTGVSNQVSRAMDTLQSRIRSGTDSGRSAFQSFTSSVQSMMSSWGSRVTSIVNSTMQTMASRAQAGGQQLASAMRSGANDAASAVQSALGRIPGIVASVGGSAASAAYSVGANIGNSMAAGMRSALGAISAAANQMVAEADRAVRARARIASPSKLFAQLGEYVGEGFEQGIRSMFGAIARASEQMVHIPDTGRMAPEYAYAGMQGGGNTQVITNTYVYAVRSDEWAAMVRQVEDAPAVAIHALNQAEHLAGVH